MNRTSYPVDSCPAPPPIWVRSLIPAWLLLAWLASLIASALDSPDGLKRQSLRVGFHHTAFQGMNRNDVEAAFKVFAMTVARSRGYQISVSTRVYESPAEFERAIEMGELDLIIINSWSYLGMETGDRIQPLFTSAQGDDPGKRYLLLTHRDGPVKALDELRGQSLAILNMADSNLGPRWFESLLQTRQLGALPDFFGTIEQVTKPSAAVLSVFFRKRQACIVDQAAFDAMAELNPQVGKQLRPLATSEPLVNSVICLANTLGASPEFRDDLISGLADLHREAAGQQILSLFGASRLLPFQDAFLNQVRKLRATFQPARAVDRP